MKKPTVIVIGGGIVGLATAHDLLRSGSVDVVLVEKETRLAAHQSGRNSGVIHSGIYYRPGTRKARFCREGLALLTAFCDAERIRWERCGKLIAAVDPSEIGQLESLYARGQANGVVCRMITGDQARGLEPRLRAVQAIMVEDTGIVDYGQVCRRLRDRVVELGGRIRCGFQARSIETQGTTLEVADGKSVERADYLVNCGGLFADRIIRLAGGSPLARIIPFRGEYYRLKTGAQEGLAGRLLYPVPDPRFPFLGVHITPTVDGEVLCGPNAVLALARQGYRWRDISVGDLLELLPYGGSWRMGLRYWRFGWAEIMRSASRKRFAKAVNGLMDGVEAADLEPARSGVRAQAVLPDGHLVDDFLLQETERALHVLNAPSPAATASLRIGQELGMRVRRRLQMDG
ncbi:MAG: L-2-hydroxyglutarate oxidase [Anaerolineales bacterium]